MRLDHPLTDLKIAATQNLVWMTDLKISLVVKKCNRIWLKSIFGIQTPFLLVILCVGYIRAHICHEYHELYSWNCHVEKFGRSIKNLNNIWSFIKVFAVFVPNLCGEKSAWRKSVWRKNDKYEVWATLSLMLKSLKWSIFLQIGIAVLIQYSFTSCCNVSHSCSNQ